MMRLDNVTVQGAQSAPLVMPRVCVCGSGSTESSHVTQPAPGSPCAACGGSLPQAAEAAAAERPPKRKLQDFLGAFV
ncbi:MAG: hypothetical protein ACJ8AT_05640 [Hyalangium sp.]|uniref:hypothetical protein n=1 Tax=Hyalangium sp. TaxID=2028555 RepID=UPI00389A03D7